MYAYEGIGAVYWHMVAKLLLTLQESILEAPPETDDGALGDLIRLYDRVREGLGFDKTAVEYGAFPTDPYSHTPSARRSPATGHDRAGQRGVAGPLGRTRTGRLAGLHSFFSPILFSHHEIRTEPGGLAYLDVAGRSLDLEVPYGSAASRSVARAGRRPGRRQRAHDRGHRSDRDPARGVRPLARSVDVARIFGHTDDISRLDVSLPHRSIRR